MLQCFDSICRNALWLKKSGIQGKLLAKPCSSYSDYFSY